MHNQTVFPESFWPRSRVEWTMVGKACGVDAAIKRATSGDPFGETVPGGIIWHDLRRTLQRDYGQTEFMKSTSSDPLGHSRAGVTRVYARVTRVVLEQAFEKLMKPSGQLVEFERRVDKSSPS